MNIADILRGVAVADAVGNPLEFKKVVSREDVEASLKAKTLNVSDDTQMSLFMAEALNTWDGQFQSLSSTLTEGYLKWYVTQIPSHSTLVRTGGLLRFKELFSVESPGHTCMSSLRELRYGGHVVNDSKGNGTVMRCSPLAVYAVKHGLSNSDAMLMADIDAKITHKHPFASIASQFQVLLLKSCLEGVGFLGSVGRVCGIIKDKHPRSTPVLKLIAGALNPEEHAWLKFSYGGWVAEEALALAVASVLNSKTYTEVVHKAVSIGGDSDTVGAIAGALAIACGLDCPPPLSKKLNTLNSIEYISNLPVWR